MQVVTDMGNEREREDGLRVTEKPSFLKKMYQFQFLKGVIGFGVLLDYLLGLSSTNKQSKQHQFVMEKQPWKM